MAASRKDRPDLLDAELIEEMLRSRGWQLTEQRIKETVSTKLRALIQPQSEIETATVRGFIAGLELAAGVPKILQKEAKDARGKTAA